MHFDALIELKIKRQESDELSSKVERLLLSCVAGTGSRGYRYYSPNAMYNHLPGAAFPCIEHS